MTPSIGFSTGALAYGDFETGVRLLRERGAKPGDRVAIMLPNVAEFAVVYYGVLRAGCVVVPMNPLLKVREVAYYLGDSGAGLIFAWHAAAGDARDGAERADAEAVVVDPATFAELVDAAAPDHLVADREDADTAVILYTSGTTGRPKGAELTHANLSRNTEIVRADLLRLGPGDVVFGGLPLFHSFGQTCTLNAALRSGACLTLLPRFAAGQALQILAGHRVTHFAGVPKSGWLFVRRVSHGNASLAVFHTEDYSHGVFTRIVLRREHAGGRLAVLSGNVASDFHTRRLQLILIKLNHLLRRILGLEAEGSSVAIGSRRTKGALRI